ncbi:MAG: SDR family oxidoreductase [Planctomycetota bacterium]
MSRFTGKVAVVTGSSSGIGQATAVRLASEGASVVINYNSSPKGAEQTLADVEAAGGKGVVVQANMADVDACRMLVRKAVEEFGRLDFLLCNAAYEDDSTALDLTPETFDRVMAINLRGPFFCSQEGAKIMKDQQPDAKGIRGRIIMMSSLHEDLPMKHANAYCTSKGGLRMMMRNLAVEWAEYGILVNGIAPGAIKTAINADVLEDPTRNKRLLENIALHRVGHVDEVAGTVAFLCSDDASYFTSSSLLVDGGLTWNYEE